VKVLSTVEEQIGFQVDGELAVVEEETAFLVARAADPDDWLVRFEKSPGFAAREWAENMVLVYNRRLSRPSAGPPTPPGVQPASYEPNPEDKGVGAMTERAGANWVRFTYFKLSLEKVEEVKKIYHEEIVPTVREQWGNVDIFLLEPVDKEDDFISCTMWESQADGDIYEASGVYEEAVDKIAHGFAGPSTLKSYEIPYRA
jgi:heme-degrading monooxygenase HmoA